MPRHHIMQELGITVSRADRELHGAVTVTPYLFVPGTPHLRTSILASFADMVEGLLAAQFMAPRVPVTLELDVHLYRPAPATGKVTAVGRTVKAGRSVFVAEVEFFDGREEPFAFSAGSFMAAPDARLTLPALTSVDLSPLDATLTMPLADRAGCKRQQPGVAVLPRSEDGLNASDTVNGGLIALAAEEAALSLLPGETLSSLQLRYLQPVRVGPAVATATVRAGIGRVELRDSGRDDRLAVIATTRTFCG
jgi:acyl-coenzyme A thioesterase PaaI-like protein